MGAMCLKPQENDVKYPAKKEEVQNSQVKQ